jgi:hypothetical protein
LTGTIDNEEVDVNDGETVTEEEGTNKGKPGSSFWGDDTDNLCFTHDRGHCLDGAISNVTGRGDEMDDPYAQKERTDEELDLAVGNTKKSLKAPGKILMHDTHFGGGEKTYDDGATLTKGDS